MHDLFVTYPCPDKLDGPESSNRIDNTCVLVITCHTPPAMPTAAPTTLTARHSAAQANSHARRPSVIEAVFPAQLAGCTLDTRPARHASMIVGDYEDEVRDLTTRS